MYLTYTLYNNLREGKNDKIFGWEGDILSKRGHIDLKAISVIVRKRVVKN